MANINRVFLSGNLTFTPEVKSTKNGMSVADLSVAVNRVYKTREGESQQETTFVDVTIFGKPAEFAAQYLVKGSKVFVEGRLKLDQWTDKNGDNRKKLKVVASSIEFFTNKASKEVTE